MSFRTVDHQIIPLEDGGHAEITLRGTCVLRSDGPIYLGLFDILELARRCAGTDHELLSTLATLMKRGHRFTDDAFTINDEEPW